MAELTLGLDVGVNSVGWTLVDIAGERILASGSRIFPEGVDRDQQGSEKSKTQARRTARGTRRQIARRSQRRKTLRQALTAVGLLPDDPTRFQKLLNANPYELRRRALDERLAPHELGRALLHLGQHRGYLSNRKTDKATDKDTKGILAEMGELDTAIRQADCPTLGSYLAKLDGAFDRCEQADGPHIRRRHTQRKMYLDEFERIWAAQQPYYPDLLTDALKYGTRGPQRFPKKPNVLGTHSSALAEYGIYGLMFFQRKMYWPKSVVGRCELEPREKRCPRAARAAQRFRILQEVNNLRILDRAIRAERPLNATERATIVRRLMDSKEAKFDQIRKWLKLPETVQFNFEQGGRKKLDGHLSDSILSGKKHLGKRWKELSEEVKNKTVDILIEEDQEEDVVRRLTSECGLTEDEAKLAATVNFPDGYMSFSRRAIEKLLPHLEKGLALMGNDATDSAIHAAGYLRPDERVVHQCQFLPPSPNVTNPIVRQALVEVRKTVNAILRELVYRQGHSLVDIHVELARDAKKSFAERKQIRFDNAKRAKEREDAAAWIENFNASIKPTRATINRYLLWRGQEEFCPYCGERISPEQLFNGDADIDHILPHWQSLDDSMGNKVVAHRRCNHDKGDRTPREWLEGGDPERYERVMQFAERYLSYGKQRKFAQKTVELDDFVNRQLTDTAYISRCVSQYLQCLGTRVMCPRGNMTADVRHWWGLNSILQPDGSNRKNRGDHRHHAIDALVIAMIDSKRLFALANDRGENVRPPWEGFRQEAERLIQGINVSHRAQRRLHGALHEETFYGATQKLPRDEAVSQEKRPWSKGWIEDATTFVRRKPLAALTKTQDLEKIRDEAIRDILRVHLRARDIDPDKKGKIPTGTFVGANTPRMRSGVPIKKVRMIEQGLTFRRVSPRRNYQFVKPGNNHHIAYRAVTKKNGRKQWTAEVVTMWDAARRAKAGLPLIDQSDRDGQRFVMSLSIGEMFEIDDGNGKRLLCVVRKLNQRSKAVFYKFHTDARKASEIDVDNLYLSPSHMQTKNAQKVTVDPTGRLRRADATSLTPP